jgi:hypothetical protein
MSESISHSSNHKGFEDEDEGKGLKDKGRLRTIVVHTRGRSRVHHQKKEQGRWKDKVAKAQLNAMAV